MTCEDGNETIINGWVGKGMAFGGWGLSLFQKAGSHPIQLNKVLERMSGARNLSQGYPLNLSTGGVLVSVSV